MSGSASCILIFFPTADGLFVGGITAQIKESAAVAVGALAAAVVASGVAVWHF